MKHPDWLIATIDHLQAVTAAPDELTAEQIARHIHRALEIAEAAEYATEKTRFYFGLSGASSEDIAEIWRHLTPFERSIVVIKNV